MRVKRLKEDCSTTGDHRRDMRWCGFYWDFPDITGKRSSGRKVMGECPEM